VARGDLEYAVVTRVVTTASALAGHSGGEQVGVLKVVPLASLMEPPFRQWHGTALRLALSVDAGGDARLFKSLDVAQGIDESLSRRRRAAC
jgi:hypothetical protein